MNNFIKKILLLSSLVMIFSGGTTFAEKDPACIKDCEARYWASQSTQICVTQCADVATPSNSTSAEQSSSEWSACTDKCTSWYACKDKKCSCNKPYTENDQTKCCVGILLNTNVPFIGQCIVFSKEGETTNADGNVVTETNAFPVLMGGLTKMMVTIILLICFMGILVWGVMISASGWSDSGAKKGKELIGKVIVAIALLGASGVILRLINPNFFG